MELPREPPQWGLEEHAAVGLPEPQPEPLLPVALPRPNWLEEDLHQRQASPPPPPAPAPWRPPAPNWRAEETARRERERLERARAIAAEVEQLEDTERLPARPRRLAAWEAEQMRANIPPHGSRA